MPRIEDTALVLLAAGRSSRFEGGGKLMQELLGRPLGLHAAAAMAALPFRDRIAVVGRGAPDYAGWGFRCVPNDEPAEGMARSVRLGVDQAGAAEAVLILLADMPRVSAGHVRRLFDATEGEASVVASSDGRNATPPAIFGRAMFPRLTGLSGDAGARALIRAGRHVVTTPAELIDVDTREALDDLRALLGS